MMYAGDLPIGARFKLDPQGETLVLIDDRGSGLVAVWVGFEHLADKPIFRSVAKSLDEFKTLLVYDVE